MWGLIVLLVCVAGLHVEPEECSCQSVGASFFDFVIYAKVSSEGNDREDYNTMYRITIKDVFKKRKGKKIDDKVYTSNIGPCTAQLIEGKEYILMGKFGEGERQQITGCGAFEIGNRASDRKSN